MKESTHYKKFKEEATRRIKSEFGVDEKDIHSNKELECTVKLREEEFPLKFTADLYCESEGKKIVYMVGHVPTNEKNLLDSQNQFLILYTQHDPALPPENDAAPSSEKLTPIQISDQLLEDAKKIYLELKEDANFKFGAEFEYVIDHKKRLKNHKAFMKPLDMPSFDYFNLSIGGVSSEQKNRSSHPICGVSLDENGKYSVFIEAYDKKPVDRLRGMDKQDLAKALNSLKLKQYYTIAGFGYSLGETIKPYYFSWDSLKKDAKNVTNYGQRVDPWEPSGRMVYITNSISNEDFLDIEYYFKHMDKTNKAIPKELERCRHMPRICLLLVRNLKREEVLPVLKEIGKVYAMVNSIESEKDKFLEKELLDYHIVELFERKSFKELAEKFKLEWGFSKDDFEELYKKKATKNAIRQQNAKIKQFIEDLGDKAVPPTAHGQTEYSYRIYLEEKVDFCSKEKFAEKCDKYAPKK